MCRSRNVWKGRNIVTHLLVIRDNKTSLNFHTLLPHYYRKVLPLLKARESDFFFALRQTNKKGANLYFSKETSNLAMTFFFNQSFDFYL